MKRQVISKVGMCFVGLSLVGCLQDNGSTVSGGGGTPTNSGSDFTVVPDPTGDRQIASVPSDNVAPAPIVEDDYLFHGFTINEGALKTNNQDLRIKLLSSFPQSKMSIQLGNVCTDSTWIDFAYESTIKASVSDGIQNVSVRYLDIDGGKTDCLHQSITIDQEGPSILFSKYPTAAVHEAESVDLIFDITDKYSNVKEATCRLNGQSKACAGGRSSVYIPSLPVGEYVFEVSAKDELGNSSIKSVSWKVVSQYKKVTQSILAKNSTKVDILIVIDNSGSMQYEQKSMGSRVGRFLDVLQGLDYQIAITTTDPKHEIYGDGRFVQLVGLQNQYFLTSSMDKQSAQTILSNTLQRKETGNGSEQPIFVTYRAVERSLSADNSANKNFFRSDAQFATLVISDEDESMDYEKNKPENLVKFIHDSFNGQKAFGFHSIITRPGDTACKSTHGYRYGDILFNLSQITGGIVGSVCEADYANQVMDVADSIRNLVRTVTLTCMPVAGMPILIRHDGVSYSGTYTLYGQNLSFDRDLAAGKYEFEYNCN